MRLKGVRYLGKNKWKCKECGQKFDYDDLMAHPCQARKRKWYVNMVEKYGRRRV